MATRRDFLNSTAALSATATIAAILGPSADAAARIDYVVFNERYADARMFADCFVQAGARAMPIGEDIGQLWYGSLRELLADCRATIAGMGTHSDLFILESLAREQGMRVRFRGRHDGRRDQQTLVHSFTGGAAMDTVALAVDRAGQDWPVGLAAAMCNTPLARVAEHTVTITSNCPRTRPDYLESWMIG